MEEGIHIVEKITSELHNHIKLIEDDINPPTSIQQYQTDDTTHQNY